MTIKLSSEQLEKFGFTTQEQVIATLDKTLIKPPEPPAAPPAPVPAPAAQEPHIAGLQAFALRISALETIVATISPAAILASAATESKRVASLEVSAAIARSGGAALGQKSDPADPAPGGKAAVDPKDFGALYDSDANIRQDFVSRSSYIKYREAMAAGRIRVHAETPAETRN